MRRMLAAGLALGAVVLGLGVVRTFSADAAAVPSYHPTKLKNIGDAQQVVVVTGTGRTTTTGTLRTYQKNANGSWSEKFFAMPARNGYGGWEWASKRVQNTGTTPMGTFRITSAFGLKANPGTKVSYTKADANDYWVGDNKDAKTYNLFEPSASSKRTWRTGEAERLAAYPTQYEYATMIDFNRPIGSSIKWDATRSQYVTSKPVDVRRGSAIFLHINGSGSTAGCVSVARANMINLLKWLDPAQKPRIVMAPLADIQRV
ncbi:L,D-transpeptidase family protein [Actinoplanes sp. TFC3]|uniref:L,D-transpeptidase family protein n=1 Tax=Actinoplanes sp. TFC3 TaxID=1710355 RepID=UPI00082FA3BF|nr:L,D-transpeptidase family protein [Actinoplanes sp. TFC3]